MSIQPEGSSESDQPVTEVTFYYTKNPQFRVVHMDGVWGGLTPHGEIHAIFFNERASLPRSITYKVEEGRLGSELARDADLDGIDRVMEVEIRMTLARAISFRNWLDDKIKELQERAETNDDNDTD